MPGPQSSPRRGYVQSGESARSELVPEPGQGLLVPVTGHSQGQILKPRVVPDHQQCFDRIGHLVKANSQIGIAGPVQFVLDEARDRWAHGCADRLVGLKRPGGRGAQD